jgi:Putative ABC-transporter type IV
MRTSRIVGVALIGGAAGWAIENVLFGERHPALFPGLPWMPVYAAGAVAIILLKPHLEGLGLLERFVAYALLLSVIEAAAGLLDRAEDRKTWDYPGVWDVPHAVMWGCLGLLLEELAP